ncbi:hypothetical protein OPQ81_003808 [Rhizoctonia solani]|nr:hypothetical protein OPQ81_003808 [Rhizoctonia solani]
MFKSRPSGGMLGSVGAKIAHASTITALGNPDLRTLQDLITAEKGVLLGVQRLAGDERGDDLGDVLTHSTNLLAQFSAALTQFASYEEQIRAQMKSIRSREESLDEMKRRKRTVDHKADSADKKLAKMSAEHKSRMAQVELLNELKEEGRRLEIDIVNEEAAIGDFKRRTARAFLGLKFAGMAELAEKTTIIGDLGKLMIEEIPLHTTAPGQPRALYTGREKTAELSSEALRCIGEVRINVPVLPEPTPATATFQPFNQYNMSGPPTPGGDPGNGTFGSTAPRGQPPYNEFGEGQYSGPGGSGFSTGSLRIGEDGSRVGNTGAGEFHTLPARHNSGFGNGLPPINLGDHERDNTFSSSIADALSHDPTFSPQRAPTPPPHQPSQQASSYQTSQQPTAPMGTYAPPPGPPPGALHAHQPSDTYFTSPLPDFTQSSSPLMPPTQFSCWVALGQYPIFSGVLPSTTGPTPTGDYGRRKDRFGLREGLVPGACLPRLRWLQLSQPPNSYEPLPNPYADATRDLTPSPQPVRDPSPVRSSAKEQKEIADAAARESLASSPPPQSQSPPHSAHPEPQHAPPSGPLPRTPSPPPAQPQESNYGTPSEYPNPFSAPLPRPPALPSLGSVPPITSPTSPGTSGRTISAGAFRRNVSRSDTLDPGMSIPPAC